MCVSLTLEQEKTSLGDKDQERFREQFQAMVSSGVGGGSRARLLPTLKPELWSSLTGLVEPSAALTLLKAFTRDGGE